MKGGDKMNWWQMILASLVGNLSPALRETIKTWIIDMEKRAKETPNPYDDLLVAGLKILFSIQ